MTNKGIIQAKVSYKIDKRAMFVVRDDILKVVNRTSFDLETAAKDNIQDNDTIDKGQLMASVHNISKDPFAIRIEPGIKSKLKYAGSIEFGSRPHTPPLEPLIEWVRRKGIGTAFTLHTFKSGKKKGQSIKRAVLKGNRLKYNQMSIAFLIQMSIKRKGTKAYPFLMPAFNYIAPIFTQRIEKVFRKHNIRYKRT